jgi:hypothetical protein
MACVLHLNIPKEDNLNLGSFNRPKPGAPIEAGKASTDNARKWMWWFLVAVVSAQFYYVYELLGALLLFSMVYAIILALVTTAYLFHRAWAASVTGVEKTLMPLAHVSRRGLALAEYLGRKTFRVRSEHVQ